MAMNNSNSRPPLNVHDADDRQLNVLPSTFEYAVADVRHPRVDSLSQSTRGSLYPPTAPSDVTYSPEHDQTSIQSHQSITRRTIDSSRDLKVTTNFPAHSSGSPPLNATMIIPHPSSVGSASTPSYSHGRGSLGGSEAWSPSSGRGQGPSQPDEQPARSASGQSPNKSGKGGDGNKNEDEDPPPWSELKTKAGKERKRLPLACIACRRKKIRCSGEKPACKHCLRSRVPCVYKVAARKAAPRTDYMAMLDKRLKRMEERVIKMIPKEGLPDLSATGRAVVKPALPEPTSKSTKANPAKKRSADETFSVELDGWTKRGGRPLGVGDSSGRPRNVVDSEKQLMTEGEEFLPTKELQEHLAEVFFECVYGQSYLLLHKPSFMRKLKADTVPPVLILAVCAISARFSTHPELNTEPAFLRGDMWATPARAIVERRHGEPNIMLLTVMVILGLHYFGTCEGGLSWSFGGQAMRMAFALQLHRELDHDPLSRKNDKASELSFTDREIRRRAMWASFLMDRFNASGTERPPFGNEEFLRIQLPIKESLFQMEIAGPTEDLEGNVPTPVDAASGQVIDPKENMGVAAYVIRAVVLWGRIVKYLNLGGKERDKHPIWSPESGFAQLQSYIDNFRKSMPPSLVYNAENLQNHAAERVANQFLYLHIIDQQNMLFLYRFAIPLSPHARPPKDMPKQFLNDSGRFVVEAASQISHLIEQSAGHTLTVPFAGYCAYVASTVQIWGIFSQNPQLEAVSKENLRHNYKYLSKMKKYWGMLHYMAENIREIYRHFADAAIKGPQSTASSSNPSSPLVQYGDWFDKYPRGIRGNDFDDLDKEARNETDAEVMITKRPDLQSVEEFFASLSPPSKNESTKKVARRNVKKATETKTHQSSAHPPPVSSPRQHQHRQSQPRPNPPQLQNLAPSLTSQPRNLTPTTAECVSSPPPPPQLYQSQQTPQTATFNIPSQNFEFNPATFFPTNSLSQLDRQLVFGAYAGMDGAFNHNPLNSAGGGYDMWEGMDMNTHQFGNTGIGGGGECVEGTMEPHEPSPAWFMPFNMNPPQIGDVDASLYMAAGGGGGGGSFSPQGMGGVGMTDGQGQG